MAGDDPQFDAAEPPPVRSGGTPAVRRLIRWLGTALLALFVLMAMLSKWALGGWHESEMN